MDETPDIRDHIIAMQTQKLHELATQLGRIHQAAVAFQDLARAARCPGAQRRYEAAWKNLWDEATRTLTELKDTNAPNRL